MRAVARGAAAAMLLAGALAQGATAAPIGWMGPSPGAAGWGLRAGVLPIADRRQQARGRPRPQANFHANNFRRDVRTNGARHGYGGGGGGDWGPSWGGLALGVAIGAGIAAAAGAAASAGAAYPPPPPYAYGSPYQP